MDNNANFVDRDAIQKCFAHRLNTKLREMGFESRDLVKAMRKYGLKGSDLQAINMIGHWRQQHENGDGSIPSIPNLIILAKALEVPIDWLLCVRTAPLAEVVEIGETAFEEARKELLKGTTQQLWMQLRTGKTFNAWSGTATIASLIDDKDIKVRLMVCDPGKDPAESSTMEIVGARRKDTGWDPAPGAVAEDITATIKAARFAARNSKRPENFEIKYVPYPFTTFSYIADPGTSEGRAIAILYNFRKSLFTAPVMDIHREHNEAFFDFLVEDYERHWNWNESKSVPITIEGDT